MIMAQPPHRPGSKPPAKQQEEREREEREVQAREERREREERERSQGRDEGVKVPLPGTPPLAEMAQEHEGHQIMGSDLTQSEQETGRQAVQDAGERLKDEQAMGSRLVSRNKEVNMARPGDDNDNPDERVRREQEERDRRLTEKAGEDKMADKAAEIRRQEDIDNAAQQVLRGEMTPDLKPEIQQEVEEAVERMRPGTMEIVRRQMAEKEAKEGRSPLGSQVPRRPTEAEVARDADAERRRAEPINPNTKRK
jgi:hypothetical protein